MYSNFENLFIYLLTIHQALYSNSVTCELFLTSIFISNKYQHPYLLLLLLKSISSMRFLFLFPFSESFVIILLFDNFAQNFSFQTIQSLLSAFPLLYCYENDEQNEKYQISGDYVMELSFKDTF